MLLISSNLAVFLMNAALAGAISMLMISLHPRDANSQLIAPVPENRSRMADSSKSVSFISMLNNPSFAKSVVGLALYSTGKVIERPLSFPPIILIVRLSFLYYFLTVLYLLALICFMWFNSIS